MGFVPAEFLGRESMDDAGAGRPDDMEAEIP